MKKQIMRRAHQLAKHMEGDYTARLALALRQAWKECKDSKDVIKKDMTVNGRIVGRQIAVKAGMDVKVNGAKIGFKEATNQLTGETFRIYEVGVNEKMTVNGEQVA